MVATLRDPSLSAEAQAASEPRRDAARPVSRTKPAPPRKSAKPSPITTRARARPPARPGPPGGAPEARLYFSSPFREGSLNGDPARHTIYVKKLGGQKLCLKVRPGDTILSLKQKIRDKDNIPVAQQRLIFRGTQLVDEKRLYESNIFDCATMHLVLRHAPA